MGSDYSGNYDRSVRFQDTDAAGVVFFANVLTICHEAYEYSLEQFGFDIKIFFSNSGDYAVPIVQAQVDFLKPIFCGDRLLVNLKPQILDVYSFEINYKITNQHSKLVSTAQTKHTCISLVGDRAKLDIPVEIRRWIMALPKIP
jgi:1,4-dihydroxy-2-naphthoyl-CoA hydrolase